MEKGEVAANAKLEKEVKRLRKENRQLQEQLEDTKYLYEQLKAETPLEKFDEKRFNLLKSQIIQLERQNLILSEAIGSRSQLANEVGHSLNSLANICRKYITMDCKGPHVPVMRADLTTMVGISEAIRVKLFKNTEIFQVETLGAPLHFGNSFLKNQMSKEVTLLDVASGKPEFLNLNHVSKLESKLSSLFRELLILYQCLGGKRSQKGFVYEKHIVDALEERRVLQILKCCAMLQDCSENLIHLSLLYPGAPWAPLKKPILLDITVDRALQSLPQLPKNKLTGVQNVVEAIVKASNYKQYMMKQEIKALHEELSFHQDVYELQESYCTSLINALRQGFKDFQESSKGALSEPLSAILKSYKNLEQCASETTWKDFITVFKKYAEHLQMTVDELSDSLCGSNENNGEVTLNSYWWHFEKALTVLVKRCQASREAASSEKIQLQQRKDQLEMDVREMIIKNTSHSRKTEGTSLANNAGEKLGKQ